VTAYFSKHTPDNGTVLGNLMVSSLFSSSRTIGSRIEKYGDDNRGYETLQLFDEALPYGWYMPLVPVRFLNKNYNDLLRVFQKKLVVRRHSAIYENEFNVPTPIMDLMATNYAQMNLSIILRFIGAVPQQLKFRRVQDIGVTDVNYELLPDHAVQVRIPRLRKGETLKITW
jgi:hypothetical protein